MKEIVRLPGEYRRSRTSDRLKLPVGFPLRPDSLLIALLLGAASFFGQAFLSTSASAQGFTPQAGVDRIAEDDIRVAGSPGSFGTVSVERPSLLVSMIEEDQRPGWAISHGASLEGNNAPEAELDRRSLIIAPPNLLISARESVSRFGSAEVSTSDRARYIEFTSAVRPTAKLLGENVSPFSLLPKRESGSWLQNFAPLTDSDTPSVDSGVASNQAGNDFRPIMIVRLGTNTFPVSLYVPRLHDGSLPQ